MCSASKKKDIMCLSIVQVWMYTGLYMGELHYLYFCIFSVAELLVLKEQLSDRVKRKKSNLQNVFAACLTVPCYTNSRLISLPIATKGSTLEQREY